MHDDKRTMAASWMRAAKTDLDAALELSARLPPPACFHAQQATEKILKAVLIMLAGDAPRLHVIGTLLEEIAALGLAVPDDVAMPLRMLDQYYLPTRYPDALGGGDAMSTYNVAQAATAVESARAAFSWAETTIAKLE